jgi:DNA processing protein
VGLELTEPRKEEIVALVTLLRHAPVALERLGGQAGHSAVNLLQMTGTSGGADVEALLAEARQEVSSWAGLNFTVHTILDPSYPQSLRSIPNRPPFFFIQGQWREDVDCRAVAVVGTRKPSVEGVKRARRLARDLVQEGYTVVSGLALGIDTAVHEATLLARGRTVAVVGTGLTCVYPKTNTALAQRILEARGAIISQFLPFQPPTKWTFPMRNAVMSGLTLATVVVEAGETSGARMQARIALKQGREVFLLRSLVSERTWAHRYVEEGAYGRRAIEVGSTAEIVEHLAGPVFAHAQQPP